jgi:O-antigen/teichoic acid export membrane protein
VSEAVETTSGSTVVRGGLWHTANLVVPQLYSLVASIVAARFLGPDGMGRQSYIAFVALSVTLLLSGSMWVSLVRHIGETMGRGEAGAVRGLLTWAWRIAGVSGFLGGSAIAALALAGAEPEGAWLLAAAITTASILHTIPSAILTGLQRFKQASIVGLTTGLVGTAATIVVLDAGGGIVGMFAVELVVGLINLAWTGILAQRVLLRVAPIPAPAGPLRRQVTRYALGYSAGIVLELVVARRSELFFLARSSTDEQIAFYSIAFAMVTAASQLPRALAAVTTPAFATLYGAGSSERISVGFNRGLRLLLIGTLPLTAAGLALAPELAAIVYGEDFRAVNGPLLILLAGFPLFGLTSLANALLTGLGKLRIPIAANGFAAVIDVALAVTLAGPLGARGAAIANLSGQVVYAAVVLGYTLALVGRDRPDGAIFRCAAASAAAGGAAWSALEAIGAAPGLVAGKIAFVAVFALLAPILRVVPRQDADWLVEVLGPKAPAWIVRFVRLCSGT